MAKIERSNMTATDSSGKVIREPRHNKDMPEMIKFYWWEDEDDKQMAENIAATVKFIADHENDRIDKLTCYTRLYGTSVSQSILGPTFTRSTSNSSNGVSGRVTFNVCRSLIDTLTAKISKNKVIPTFVTNGGVWGMQKKSRDLSKFIEGCFYQNEVHSTGTYGFRDAATWGTGVIYTYRENNKICIEKVYPHELFIDHIESVATDPRQIHRVKYADRGVLRALFGDDEECLEIIDNAMPASYEDIGSTSTTADLIKVIESWHLRSGEDADDGLHVITVGDDVLFKEEWTKDYFPFSFFHYSKDLIGFWGSGVCERQLGKQNEINSLMMLDSHSRRMMSSFKILVENGSKVVSQHLNNDVGTIVHYTGTAPQYVTPPPIDASNAQQIDAVIAKAFQEEGVSQMSASSMKPMGLDSGKALRVYLDNEADRQLFISQELEKFYLNIAKQMIGVAKDIYKDTKTYKVVFPSGKFMETVDWKDVQLEDDEYVMQAFPVSSLADDMSGRLQEVQELAQAGMITPRTARKLMRTPDLEMNDNLANAAEDLLCKVIEDIIDKEEFTAPMVFMDLVLGKQLALEYYNYAMFQNAPQKVLALLERFISQIDDINGVAAGPPPQVASPANGAPPANPAAPPVSNLIPNVNQQGAA